MIDQRYRDLAGAAEEAARPPEFAEVRRRGGRLRARRRVGGALAAAVLVASGVAGVAALQPSDEKSWDPAVGFGQVLTADAADAKHLYAITAACDDCPRVLVASGDGGRTWTERRELEGATGTAWVEVLGPETLLLTWTNSATDWNSHSPVDPDGSPLPYRAPPSGAPSPTLVPGGITQRAVSLDGGRTLRELTVSDTPVAAAAPGTQLINCRTVARPQNCLVYAVDPDSGQIAPLATQPPLAPRTRQNPNMREPVDVPVSAGLWVTGNDPETGRPAVAVSDDQGRTWRKSVFDGGTGQILGMYAGPAVAVNGTEAYAVFADADVNRFVVFRSTDGGRTWKRTRGEFPRDGIVTDTVGMVTSDGTHVLPGAYAGGHRYLASKDGERYTPVELHGLAPREHGPKAVANRFFVYQGEGELYVSTDGRNWHLALG